MTACQSVRKCVERVTPNTSRRHKRQSSHAHPTVTMFKGTLSVGGNRLIIPEAPPEGSGGASGESGTRITPTLALTYQVEPARTFFAPSRVRFRVEGMVDGTTYAKQYNLPGQPPETNLFEVQWDGTDNLGNRVPDGDYTVRASVYSKWICYTYHLSPRKVSSRT